MKLLIATRSDDNITEMSSLTHPLIKQYAKKCNAHFLEVCENEDVVDPRKLGQIHYRIMFSKDLLEDFDRILWIDSDAVVSKNCPDLFKVVPYDKIGTIYEDKGSRQRDRRNRIKKAQMKWEYIGWKEGYINTGVFLVSKPHQEIFKKIDSEYWMDWGYDDVHLGYLINKLGIEVHELPFQYNHMSMFSEAWNGHANKLDSFIIHQAGRKNLDQLKSDIEKLK